VGYTTAIAGRLSQTSCLEVLTSATTAEDEPRLCSENRDCGSIDASKKPPVFMELHVLWLKTDIAGA